MLDRLRDRAADWWFNLKGTVALVIIGLAVLLGLTGCQSSPPKWEGYRFDKHWRAHRVN